MSRFPQIQNGRRSIAAFTGTSAAGLNLREHGAWQGPASEAVADVTRTQGRLAWVVDGRRCARFLSRG